MISFLGGSGAISETFNFVRFLFDQDKNHETPDFSQILENPDSWDHAQMKERKKLYNLAERKPLYDQTRP